MKTYCNPMNLGYRFQVRGWADQCLREAADPSVVYYRGEYWLFASKSGGYWHSVDMRNWSFTETSSLPAEDYAPDIRVINGQLVFTASRAKESCPIYRTQDPGSDTWELVSEPFVYWDPNLFQDEDGKVYMYWGCSDRVPIQGIEMDPQTLTPIGEPVALITQRHDIHGWERGGENNSTDAAPYVEGAWMDKHNGRYYLQYAAPGTQYNSYGDGVYIGDSPLGPFTYQPHNPFSFKPGGFICGAGHGSTFADTHGNLWHISTMRISLKHDFERRLGLFPAGFDKDGVLYCNNRFADYPQRFPDAKQDPLEDSFTGWMLLSRNKPVSVSSELPGHPAAHAVSEDIRTWWSAASGENGEWLTLDLGAVCSVRSVQINFYEQDCEQFGREGDPLCHQYTLEASEDGEIWKMLADKSANQEDVPHDYVEFESPVPCRYIRITNHHMPAKGKFALSGLRVFGHGVGTPPERTENVSARRRTDDRMTCDLSWNVSTGADGYNVLWGIDENKLYNSWLVYDHNHLELRALNSGSPCFVRIDAFNENGITEGNTLEVTQEGCGGDAVTS